MDADWKDEGDAVFRGGGVKGLGLVGALQGFAAHPRKPIHRWVNVAGASAGAIIAAYLAVHPQDGVETLEDVVGSAPFASFEDVPYGGHGPGAVANLMLHHGLARGDAFQRWFTKVLGGASFGATRATDGGPSNWHLQLVAVDMTGHRLLLLPDDLALYREPGSSQPIDPDTFSIARAVRMSMSIPYFFEPVPLIRDRVRILAPGNSSLVAGELVDRATVTKLNKAPSTGEVTFEEVADAELSLIIDGGTLSNFPVWIFDVDPDELGRQPKRMTFGFTLTGGRGVAPGAGALARMAPWPVRFGIDIFHTAQSAWDVRFASHSTRVRTVAIDAGDVGTTEFDLTQARKDQLLASGRMAAATFLDRFAPETYVNTFGASVS